MIFAVLVVVVVFDSSVGVAALAKKCSDCVVVAGPAFKCEGDKSSGGESCTIDTNGNCSLNTPCTSGG